MEKKWLSLIEYSSVYGVSVSTLRRRIRKNEICFQRLGGKYFVEDTVPAADEQSPPRNQGRQALSEGDNLTGPENLVAELKSAFRLVLQEKEEQIYLLKEEVAHLNKLVGLLEEENSRLKNEYQMEKGREATTFFQSLTD